MAETIEALKREAAEAAVGALKSGMVVGLGTGSTAHYAVLAVGRQLAEGKLQEIVAIPTSEETAALARQLGIPLSSLDEHPVVDVAIDGADEIDPQLNLIKGLGASLLREKIVESCARRLIIIADERKLVERLGTRAPVPVEVIPFAKRPAFDFLQTLGCRPVLRQEEGKTRITDEGNILLDCYFEKIEDAYHLAEAIKGQPGVVEHGLFLGMASEAYVALPGGVRHLEKKGG
ncbi:MAG: ribose-5-phosphate isomerase RpiA [Candidatus Promineifilaceae bacterium]